MTKYDTDKIFAEMRSDILSLAINNPKISLRSIEEQLIRLYGKAGVPSHVKINAILNEFGYYKIGGRWEKK